MGLHARVQEVRAGLSPVFHLGEPRLRWWLYQVVFRESGGPENLTGYLGRDMLIALWPKLHLSQKACGRPGRSIIGSCASPRLGSLMPVGDLHRRVTAVVLAAPREHGFALGGAVTPCWPTGYLPAIQDVDPSACWSIAEWRTGGETVRLDPPLDPSTTLGVSQSTCCERAECPGRQPGPGTTYREAAGNLGLRNPPGNCGAETERDQAHRGPPSLADYTLLSGVMDRLGGGAAHSPGMSGSIGDMPGHGSA